MYQRSFISGASIAAAPALPAVVAEAAGAGAFDAAWVPWVTAGAAASWFAGGLALMSWPRTGRALIGAGWLGLLATLASALVERPAVALAVALLGLMMVLGAGAREPTSVEAGVVDAPKLVVVCRGACITALVLWAGLWPPTLASALTGPALAGSFVIATALVLGWLLRARRQNARRRGVVALALVGAAAALAIGDLTWKAILATAAVLPATAAIALPPASSAETEAAEWWVPLIDHPARLLVSTFAFLCLCGTVLFLSPWAIPGPGSLDFSTAGFTAVSAVCVTGLTVIDPGTELSGFGQGVLLLLIQLGGLGIMGFSTAAMRLLGHRMSMRTESAVAGVMSAHDRSRLYDTVVQVMKVTFGCEVLGAVLLTSQFAALGDSPGQAAWRGLFTAVSAFCNAGFALQPDSLVPYQGAPGVLHTVGALIVLGGLSPAAVALLPRLVWSGARLPGARVRIVVTMTVALLAAAFAVLVAVEWTSSLAHLPPLERVHNAWFQAVTLRTAGFNSIELGDLRPASLSVMYVMMFVGGNPGGTAGGIKTTTAAVLLLAVLTAIRGRGAVVVFGRRIPHVTVYRAAAITVVGFLSGLMAIIAIQLTQTLPQEMAFFEVVSALGTVGLTLGATPMLDAVGRTIIVICMFMGRVGPLTLFMLLSGTQAQDVWERPVEDVEVG